MSEQQGGSGSSPGPEERGSGTDPWAPAGGAGGQPGPGYGAPQPTPPYGSPPGGSSPAGSPPGGPGGYTAGYPGHGYPAAKTTSSNAIVALVLAILSFPVCPVIFAIIALVLAKSAEREIAESHGTKEGEGLVRATRIISWINIALFGLILALAVILAIVGIMGANPGVR